MQSATPLMAWAFEGSSYSQRAVGLRSIYPHIPENARRDVWDRRDTLCTQISPFAPSYAPQTYEDDYWIGRNPVDYTHAREWRVSYDLEFTVDKVVFIVVDTYEDMAQAPKELKDSIGRDSWLIMVDYRKIEDLWTMHRF